MAMEEYIEILPDELQTGEITGDERDGHRLRLRLMIERGGFERLRPHQVLEFILYYAIPRQDVTDTAHAILNHFGNLKAALHSSLEELNAVEGIGSAAVEWMYLLNQCVNHCENAPKLPDLAIKNFAHAFDGAARIGRAHPRASLVEIFLDAAGKAFYYAPYGFTQEEAHWASDACMRESLRKAILMKPRSVMLMGFMPEFAMPDDDEMDRIQCYADTLSRCRSGLVDVVLSDRSRIFSMRQQGLITREKPSPRLNSLREAYMRGMPAADEARFFQIPMPEEKVKK